MIRTILLASAAFMVAIPAVANADVAFTQVNPNSYGMSWTRSGSTGSLADIPTSGYADLLVNLTLNSGSIVNAMFHLTGSSSLAATLSGSIYEQDGINGGFSFTGTDAGHTDYLTGTFTNGAITGSGVSGSLFSTSNGAVIYSSGTEVTSGAGSFSLALNNTNNAFSASPGLPLDSFKAHGTGTFTAAAVPEPSSWGMMMIGFAVIGAMVRRRGFKRPSRLAVSLS